MSSLQAPADTTDPADVPFPVGFSAETLLASMWLAWTGVVVVLAWAWTGTLTVGDVSGPDPARLAGGAAYAFTATGVLAGTGVYAWSRVPRSAAALIGAVCLVVAAAAHASLGFGLLADVESAGALVSPAAQEGLASGVVAGFANPLLVVPACLCAWATGPRRRVVHLAGLTVPVLVAVTVLVALGV